jgi:hypothetical protein
MFVLFKPPPPRPIAMNFDRVAFVVMAVIAAMGIFLAGGLHAYHESVNLDLKQQLKVSRMANQEWLTAFKKLSDRVGPSPLPPRPQGQIGEAPPH